MLKKLKLKTLGLFAMVFAMVTAFGSAASAATPAPDFSGVSLGFSPMDMITGAVSFLAIFDIWIIIALSILFAPVLVWIAFWLVGKVRKAMAR